ncbi:hypothetical protein Vretimale_9973 [Volvox reticuliferus]|uniref:Uncharacterized protein n=1 Tax=Volvox reticuliferus TaxID=1737510 RepID=A0A8J4GEI8_9CHLO|nr:hypothetical protein Vretifemale_13742 [Volvox reticuliferus]GIM05484.1 hypothetical protein Vretimale_9973 [Volvox reticuliferus]
MSLLTPPATVAVMRFYVYVLLLLGGGTPCVRIIAAKGPPKGSILLPCPPDPGLLAPAVNTSMLWSKSLSGLNDEATAQLKPFFNYKFLLPEQSVRAGLDYSGAARRLRKFVQDLLRGDRSLKIGVVGGSISYGIAASRIGETDWFSIFVDWLSSSSKAPVTGRNGCRPATPSAYMVFCLENSVDPDVDLVFVE